MNLHSHGLAGANGALVSDGLGTSIATDVVGGDASDGVVVQRKTGTGATVIWCQLDSSCTWRKVGEPGSRETYHILAVDPELLERGMASNLLCKECSKGSEKNRLHG